jgi:propanol-preferring alcohol dehydrogenase
VPPGGQLGVWGFGRSAHLATQVAVAQGRPCVFTRGHAARELALSLGAASAQGTDPSPEPLIRPLRKSRGLVPVAMATLDRGGGTLWAGIYLSAIRRWLR